MKAERAQLDRALKAPGSVRLFLFHGPDDAGSRALARAVATAVGKDAERVDLSGSDLKADPARLADEAAAICLFGGARHVLVDPAGDESLAAVEALLGVPAAGNPVVLLAGALKPTSKLLKLVTAAPDAIAFASYVPEARDGGRLAIDLGRERGLDIRQDVARIVAERAAGNRAIIAQEVEKFALYLDAAPDRPMTLDSEALAAVGAANEEGDLSRLVDCVLSGRAADLQAELNRLSSEGVEGIALVRAMLRRVNLLIGLRAEVERGSNPAAVMASKGKGIFWKEQKPVAAQLSRWRSDLLAKSLARLLEAERQAKASGGLGALAVSEEMLAICRQAARLG